MTGATLHTSLKSSDFYSLIHVSRDASTSDVKVAYHHTLLRLHPDKRSQLRRHDIATADATTDSPSAEASFDVALLKEAYRTLSDAGLRAAYDRSLMREERTRSCGPRPAQVVSLEEFTAATDTVEGRPRAGTEAETAEEWWHRCRCGGAYRITQADLENGMHLVGCEGCSEVIWVGYEEAPATDQEE